jgi:hypothetical protein
VVVIGMAMGPAAWAEETHEHGHGATAEHTQQVQQAAAGAQTITGEVTDVFCYLSHREQGQGKAHASCAKKCIGSGLPVAIRSGGMLYLATMADHGAANKELADLAGQTVTVRGKVLEGDGQRLIAIEEIQQ